MAQVLLNQLGRNGASDLSDSTAGSAHNDVRNGVPHAGVITGSPVARREHHVYPYFATAPRGFGHTPD